jgi:Bacterial SH3 domain
MAELQTNIKKGAVIGGWVCFGVGTAFMFLSLWAVIFYAPLFFAAFVLSIVAMAQGRVAGGLTLLLCCVIIPSLTFLGLMARLVQPPDSLMSPSPSTSLETATPTLTRGATPPSPAELATTSATPIAPTQSQSEFTSETTPTPSPAELATMSSTPVEVAPQAFPEPTFTITPNALDASAVTATPAPSTYRVIGISSGDYLNVRDGAGSNYPVVATLEPGTGGIVLGTKRAANGETTWQEIFVGGHSGWVNADYIALETQAPTSPTPSPAPPR